MKGIRQVPKLCTAVLTLTGVDYPVVLDICPNHWAQSAERAVPKGASYAI